MADPIKIVSEAQRAMFERAASDPHYARARGLSQELAQAAIDTHKVSGAPTLPDRVKPTASPAKSAKAPKLLGSMRD